MVIMSFNQLKVEDIEKISLKIYENACELIEEAEILYNHKKFARAHACAQFSIEEFAKLPMLFTIATKVSKGDKVDWKDLNRRLRDHKSKTSLSFGLIGLMGKNMLNNLKINKIDDEFDLYAHFPENLQEFKKFLEQDFKFEANIFMDYLNQPLDDLMKEFVIRQAIAFVLNKYKNLSLYADFNDGDFVKPSEIIHEKRCMERIKAALIEKKIIDIVIHNRGFTFDESDFTLFDSLVASIRKKVLDGD
jgi:AbiV family abortive infection protein